MPRVSRPWFRFYVEAIDDSKVIKLSDTAFRVWVTVLALARASCRPGYLMVAEGVPMTAEDIALRARKPVKAVASALEDMRKVRLADIDTESHAWFVPAFANRQFESDDVSIRTRKHRSKEQGRNVATTSVGTPLEDFRNGPDTETETDIPPNPPQSGGTPRANGTSPRQIAAAERSRREEQAAIDSAHRLGRLYAEMPEYGESELMNALAGCSDAEIKAAFDTFRSQRGVPI